MLKTNQINNEKRIDTKRIDNKKQLNNKNKSFSKIRYFIYILLFVIFVCLSTINEKFYTLLLIWVLKFFSVCPINLTPLKKYLIFKLISKTTILLSIGIVLFLMISKKDPYIVNIPVISTNINILITIFLYTIHRLCIGFCFMPFIVYQCRLVRNAFGERSGLFYRLSEYYFSIPWRKIILPKKRINFTIIMALTFYRRFGRFWKNKHLNSLIPVSAMYFHSSNKCFVIDIRKVIYYIDMLGYLRSLHSESFKIGVVNILPNKLIFTFKGLKLLKKIIPKGLGKILFTPAYDEFMIYPK